MNINRYFIFLSLVCLIFPVYSMKKIRRKKRVRRKKKYVSRKIKNQKEKKKPSLEFVTREDDIRIWSKEAKMATLSIDNYKKHIDIKRFDEVLKNAKKEEDFCKFRPIVFKDRGEKATGERKKGGANFKKVEKKEVYLETVDQLRDRLNKEYSIAFSEKSKKENLLKAFENMFKQKGYIQKKEKSSSGYMMTLIPKEVEYFEENVLPQMIEKYRKDFSQYQILQKLRIFKEKLDLDYKKLREKEELYNRRFKLLAILSYMEANFKEFDLIK